MIRPTLLIAAAIAAASALAPPASADWYHIPAYGRPPNDAGFILADGSLLNAQFVNCGGETYVTDGHYVGKINRRTGLAMPYPTVDNAPERRSGFAAASNGAGFFICGGSGVGGQPYSDLWGWSKRDKAWVRFSPTGGSGPTHRIGAKMVISGNQLYKVGGKVRQGESYVLTDEVWCYDLTTGEWRQVAPLPDAREGFRVSELAGEIAVWGGWSPTEGWFGGQTHIFNTSTGTWRSEELPGLPNSRDGVTHQHSQTGQVVGGFGIGEDGQPRDDSFIVDFALGTITPLPPLDRGGKQVVAFTEDICTADGFSVVLGEIAEGRVSYSIRRLDTVLNQWVGAPDPYRVVPVRHPAAEDKAKAPGNAEKGSPAPPDISPTHFVTLGSVLDDSGGQTPGHFGNLAGPVTVHEVDSTGAVVDLFSACPGGSPPPPGLSGAALVGCGAAVCVIGGYDDAVGGATDTLFTLDIDFRNQTADWNQHPLPADAQRYDHNAVLVGESSVLIAGGFLNDTPTTATVLLDPITGATAPGPDLPATRYGMAAAVDLITGDAYFAFGLNVGSAQNGAEVIRYDAVTSQFSTIAATADIPGPHPGAQAHFVPPHSLHVAGGFPPSTDRLVFDTESREWSNGSPLPIMPESVSIAPVMPNQVDGFMAYALLDGELAAHRLDSASFETYAAIERLGTPGQSPGEIANLYAPNGKKHFENYLKGQNPALFSFGGSGSDVATITLNLGIPFPSTPFLIRSGDLNADGDVSVGDWQDWLDASQGVLTDESGYHATQSVNASDLAHFWSAFRTFPAPQQQP